MSFPPRNSSGHAPLRRVNSIRRTSSIDVTWPDGRDTGMHISGVARDLYTGEQGLIRQLDSDSFTATLSPARVIEGIEAVPPRPQLQQMIGASCGNAFRADLGNTIGDELTQGTPLHFLLDDLPGASLIASWAWSRWDDNWYQKVNVPSDPAMDEIERMTAAKQAHVDRFEDVCTGFRQGSDALLNFHNTEQNYQQVIPLPHPDDPIGWHAMPQCQTISMRRARRIDIWKSKAIHNEIIHIDAMFQDSATTPDGGRAAVHEYTLELEADPQHLAITRLSVEPRVLPFKECPAAAGNVDRLIGSRLNDLRTEVLAKLKGPAGCTHLNDALRSLAEIPILATILDRNEA